MKGLKDVPLPREAIDKVFEGSKEPPDYVVGLYKLVYQEEWDQIASVGHPRCSEATAMYITAKAIEFDRQYNIGLDWHDRIQPGGTWLNKGFTVDKTMPDWLVEQSSFTVKS